MLLSSVSIGSAPSFSRTATASRPCSQVHIAVKITTASASGTQPPCVNFTMLAESSVPSINAKKPNTAIANGQLHFQARTASTNTSSVVTSIVPVTAMPYAAARLLDDLKLTTSATTPASWIQLTAGT